LIGGVLRFTNLGSYESQTLDVTATNATALNPFQPPQYVRLQVLRY
jgi:hypothetical protein